MSERKTPLWVICSDCNHKWIGLYLPMPMRDCAKVMGKLCCPKCAAGSNRILCWQERIEQEAQS